MRVDIEKVLELLEKEGEINKIPFEEIEWYLKGKQINLSKEELEEWRFTGLSNLSFISLGEYERGGSNEIISN